MTDTDILFDNEIALLTAEPYHIACCTRDAFFCGAPWHRELVATDDMPPDEVCPKCWKIRKEMRCPVGHRHCPFALAEGWSAVATICPPPKRKR